jgi:transposase InsO family protein
MSKRKNENQIVAILKEAEAGMAVKDICRKYGVASSTFYKWRDKYDGMGASDVKRLKELEQENLRFKQMFAELGLRGESKKRLPSRDPEPLAVSMDFMSDQLRSSVGYRTLNVIDDYNRELLGIDIATRMPSLRVVRYLDRLSEWHGYSKKIRVDNGSEFRSKVFTDWALANGIKIDLYKARGSYQNAYIERFNRTYRHEVLD